MDSTPPPFDCRRRFLEVADTLCRELGAPALSRHDDEAQTLVVTVEGRGTEVSLWHSLGTCPEHVLLRAVLPLPKVHGREEALLRLLHLNHDLGPGGGACFSLDADSGDGCVTLCLELQAVERGGVAAPLHALSNLVGNWRELLMTQAQRPDEAERFGPVGRA